MKKVLKIIFSVALLLALAATMSACGNNGGGAATAPAADGIQIALVAHSPESILNDGSFNQGAWDGINAFLSANNLSSDRARFYQAHDATHDARFDIITQAIDGGANTLVLPGFQFESAVYEAQVLFPEVYFITLDSTPAGETGQRIQSNVAAIHYAEEEAGFLAGYAAVMEGHRNLGFMGGAPIPPVTVLVMALSKVLNMRQMPLVFPLVMLKSTICTLAALHPLLNTWLQLPLGSLAEQK